MKNLLLISMLLLSACAPENQSETIVDYGPHRDEVNQVIEEHCPESTFEWTVNYKPKGKHPQGTYEVICYFPEGNGVNTTTVLVFGKNYEN